MNQLQSIEAIERLAGSQRGTEAMRHLMAWFDDYGRRLDRRDQHAIVTLLRTTWSPRATTRQAKG